MVLRAKDLTFSEPKRLPNDSTLADIGIVYDVSDQVFRSSDELLLLGYPLREFVSDYYEADINSFRSKLKDLINCRLNPRGYLVYGENNLPIRDLAFYANKAKKFANELQHGREKGNWVKTMGNNLSITTSQTELVTDFIKQTISAEKLEKNDIIMLKYLKKVDHQRYSMLKIFSSIDVKDLQLLILQLNRYAEGFFGQNQDYSEDIDRLELDIIKALKGGCLKRELKTNDSIKRIVHPKASNNNCFFKCIQPFVTELRDKIIKSECNKIRHAFGINDDDEIDVQSALQIFEKYAKGKNGLEIWSDDIIIAEVNGPDPKLRLWLNDNHYSILFFKELKAQQCCPQCGRKFINRHTCNTNMIVYKTIREGKERCVINTLKCDDFNFDEPNEEVFIVYDDIETHTRVDVGGCKVHTPYILGFVDNISDEFQYFAGNDCMEQFIKHLLRFNEKTKVYLNAFNGSKFDHYEFVKQLNRMYAEYSGLKLDKLLLNNGAILKATVGNIECFDISKHITGTLRQCLIELGCKVQKGEFDYSLGDDWDKMSPEDQSTCVEYLKCDVLGLKELSQKLNKSCFDNFTINLYKFMSTSQLTYAVWVNHWYKESYTIIYLQTAEQEKFFRESIYGGRTYKYKHSFVSSQRDAFFNNHIDFEEIEDYLIDADVNSLYPAAMMQDFPIGSPMRLNDEIMKELNDKIKNDKKCPKIGIFRVKYKSNKNLIDGILPRREGGRLLWDLHDSSGVYNSVDIDNALRCGYKVEIIEGYYWEKTAKLFHSYIEFLYDFKKKAKKGNAQYTLAKLMMNGHYGKCLKTRTSQGGVVS